MKKKDTWKQVIIKAIDNIMEKENVEYVSLHDIYEEVGRILKKKNDKNLQSQIRGRLQENCRQTKSYKGHNLFETKKIRSGLWRNVNKREISFKYIRYINNSYLITDDNWKTFKKQDFITEKYIQEKNLDILYEVKLKEEIGIVKASIIIDELKRIRHLLKIMKKNDKHDDGYGTAFEVFAISVIYNINFENVINNYIVHGDQDGGIDAIVYFDNCNHIEVYQIKLNEISDVAYDRMNNSYRLCSKGVIPENGRDLYNFVSERKYLFKNKKVIYKSVSWNSKKDSNIIPIYIYDKFFENMLLPSDNNHLVLYIDKPVLGSTYNIASYNDQNYTFYLSAKELIDDLFNALSLPSGISKTEIFRYFGDNIRGQLAIGENIRLTIINDPKNFVNYNLGIDITGEVRDLSDKLEISNPIINNGQQTLISLIKINKNLDKIMLCIHVKNQKDLVIRSNISIFTNEQRPVKSIDRLSVNFYIRDIQKKIFADGKYFLRIYSSGLQNRDYLIDSIYGNRVISLSSFIKLYFAVLTKNLGGWKNTFNQELEKIQINDFLDFDLAIKVCDSIIKFEEYLDTIVDKKEKDNLRSADLAFMYLLCKKKLSVLEAQKVINMINEEYYYSKETSKLIDVYKSSSIINRLDYQCKKYKKSNVKC